MMHGAIGHNSRPTREELELAFKERTRAQRIKDDTPFDLRWQWEVWLSELPPTAKLVAFAIRIYANPDGSGSRPSLDTLEQLTGLSRRCIQDNLRLIEQRFVGKEQGKGRTPNRYTLIIPGETLQELAKVIDIRSRAEIATQSPRSEAASNPQDGDVAGQSLPHETVVGQTRDRSRLLVAPDITIDLTKNKKGDAPRDGSIAKVASALAAGIAATIVPAAAAVPIDPPAQVLHDVAECWHTPKARMEATLNPHERLAQFQVWATSTGLVEVTGEFRDELAKEYPLVDLKCGLAAAGANVNPALGALNAMKTIRRQFGYMQQDAMRRKPSAPVAEPQERRPDHIPEGIWARLQADKAKAARALR